MSVLFKFLRNHQIIIIISNLIFSKKDKQCVCVPSGSVFNWFFVITAANKVDENEDGVTAPNPDGFFSDLTDSVSNNFFWDLISFFIECMLRICGCQSETSRWKRIIGRNQKTVHQYTRFGFKIKDINRSKELFIWRSILGWWYTRKYLWQVF